MQPDPLEFVRVQPEHIVFVANNMRKDDLAEIEAMSGRSPFDALNYAVSRSMTSTAVLLRGEPVCIYGVVRPTILHDSAIPWMLGTDRLKGLKKSVFKHGAGIVSDMTSKHSHLFNYVDARNTPAIRLLRRLGFKLHPAEPYGEQRLPFHFFEMRSKHV